MSAKLIIQHFQRSEFSSHSEFRKEIKYYLLKVVLNKEVVNEATGFIIRFNRVGIEKMISSIGDSKAFALCNLQPILAKACLSETQDDVQRRPDIIKVFLFKTKVEIERREYEVWCYVRQTPSGYFLYSLNMKA